MSRPGPVVVGAGGTRLATWVHGPHDAPTVVLQHGVGSSCGFLAEAVVPPLLELGWQVVAAPVRGHAGADAVRDRSEHALAGLAADVGALVAATGAVACGGVSIGGHAAVAAVARGLAPPGTRVVAALPSWTGWSVAGTGPHAAVAAEVRAVGVEGMRRRLGVATGLHPWLGRVLQRDLALHDEASLAAALLALDGGEAPGLDDLARLPPGCGVVGWDGDPGHPLAVAASWAETMPSATLATLGIGDPDADPVALGRAVARALGPPVHEDPRAARPRR